MQKAKFIGSPRSVFNVGTKAFPYGVWVECPAGVFDLIRKSGSDVVKQFEFDPPIEPEKELTVTEGEIKPRKSKGRKSSNKTEDNE